MYGVIVIALFAAYSFIFYGIHRIDKRETKEEIENLKSCITYRDKLMDEMSEEAQKLAYEKEKAVKACRKYREKLNLVYGNLKNLNDTYSSNEVNLCKAIEQNIYLSGQLKMYKDAYGEIKQSEN